MMYRVLDFKAAFATRQGRPFFIEFLGNGSHCYIKGQAKYK